MRIEHITEMAVDHMFGRLLRRVLMAIAVAAYSALWRFTILPSPERSRWKAQYGELYARLIVGAIYAAVAIASAIALGGQRPGREI